MKINCLKVADAALATKRWCVRRSRPSRDNGGDFKGLSHWPNYIRGMGTAAVWVPPQVANLWDFDCGFRALATQADSASFGGGDGARAPLIWAKPASSSCTETPARFP